MNERLPPAPGNVSNRPRLSRLGRASVIISAAVLAGVIAASAGDIATAQAVVEMNEPSPTAAKVAFAQVQDESEPTGDDDDTTEDAPNDSTVERFEQCLEESAAELEELEAQDDLDGASIEAAFEKCGSLLDDFSFDFGDDDGNFSFDLDFGDDPHVDFDFGDDPHLDFDFDDGNFSFDFGDGFQFDIDLGLSAEDAAVFEEYEGCLDDAGITFDGWFDDLEDLDETNFDDIEKAFSDCEPILDDLSDEVHDFFDDCPEGPDAEDPDADEDE